VSTSTEAPRRATLIVLAWNQWDLTRRCLESLFRTDLLGSDVIVVDNGSTDETPRGLSSFDGVRVVTLPKNLGFVRGNNAGIAAARPDTDVVLLNNDVEFPQRDWLARMRACAYEAPGAGIVGCRLVLPDGRMLHAGTYILPDTFWGQQIGSDAGTKDVGQYPARREVEGVVFACVHIRREVIQAIGGLCEEYESYFEDTDYCLTARSRGFKTVVCGSVTLVHAEHGSTRRDPAMRNAALVRSREAFRRRWGRVVEARYRRELVWHSVMNLPTGYCTSCREILRALDDEGVRVAYRYAYGPGSPIPHPEPHLARDYRLDVMRGREIPRRPAVAVVFGQADAFHRARGRRRVGFTMLEVDGFPRDWVRQANRMDEVWVPSEFNREGILRSGLRRPVFRIPLGVDTNYFHPGAKAHPNPAGEFVFLACFEWGERKAPALLLKTFNETFRAAEPVRLLCKIINRDPGAPLKEEIQALRLRSSGGRISYLFNLDFPYAQLPSLYRSADCFVSVSRGEGWDLPLIEAMACGLPAIATDWGGHREFVRENNSYPLRVRGVVPAVARCPYYAGFSWADPDAEHFRYLLRHVFESREEARARGMRAAVDVARHWTWRHTAWRIVERLEALTA
jgi:GT2 family glycosyltransferase